MPSGRELKVLLRPLLKRRPDLAFDHRMLFFRPLTHYLRGVVFISFVFRPNIAISFATQLFNNWPDLWFRGRTGQYEHELPMNCKENLEGVSEALCDHLERHSLPLVESLTTPSAHESSPHYLPGYSVSNSPVYMLAVTMGACFDGDFDRAQTLADAFVSHEILPYQRESPPIRAMLELHELLRTDRALIPPLMHEWEEAKVDALKLRKYWKSAPFPFEA